MTLIKLLRTRFSKGVKVPTNADKLSERFSEAKDTYFQLISMGVRYLVLKAPQKTCLHP